MDTFSDFLFSARIVQCYGNTIVTGSSKYTHTLRQVELYSPGTRNIWMNTHRDPMSPPNENRNPTNSHALATKERHTVYQ